jgi:hypothetical protein
VFDGLEGLKALSKGDERSGKILEKVFVDSLKFHLAEFLEVKRRQQVVHDLFFCVDRFIASQLALDEICDFLDDFLDSVSCVLVISSKDVRGLCEHIFKGN